MTWLFSKMTMNGLVFLESHSQTIKCYGLNVKMNLKTGKSSITVN